jgi:hypothetical protein
MGTQYAARFQGGRSWPSVGGFVTVLSNRDIGFRFSVYSDVLLDWPMEQDELGILQLTDKFDPAGLWRK